MSDVFFSLSLQMTKILHIAPSDFGNRFSSPRTPGCVGQSPKPPVKCDQPVKLRFRSRTKCALAQMPCCSHVPCSVQRLFLWFLPALDTQRGTHSLCNLQDSICLAPNFGTITGAFCVTQTHKTILVVQNMRFLTPIRPYAIFRVGGPQEYLETSGNPETSQSMLQLLKHVSG